MSTRIISSPDLAGTEAGSSRSRSQRPIHLEIDGVIDEQEGAGRSGSGTGGQYNQIRPTTSSSSLPLPPLISNTRRARRSSSPTTTTQQPRPSHSPPRLPPLDIQTPPWRRATNLPSANVELPPVNTWENEHSGQYNPNSDLHNILRTANIGSPDLIDLIDGDFSSPSTYPLFTNIDPQPSQAQTPGVSQTAALQASISAPHRAVTSATTAPRDPSAAHHCISNFLGPERSTTQLSSSTNAAGESQSTLPIFDSFDESDILFDSPASSFSDAMPPALRRSTAATVSRTGSTHTSKRRRTSTAAANENTIPTRPSSRQKKSSAPKKEMDVEELFGSSPPPRAFVDLEANEDYDTVDLTETNEVPDEIKKPEKDNSVKLAAFQCVICMDDCINLTVTHCGHLYCASCLHQSLCVDATKGKCPMCRQKLDMKPRENYNSKTKGYWPLELKLMTATRKGKRKANILS
ncbi:hypothetical protein FVEN_g7890 [Fusarium venenatum]|nr:hypothetical protein FVEN_g7890 [Fusarium venenatum]KAH6965450.1 hypothetical protein EDB82DRAFT_512703 [Fusarium venenatum]